MIAEIGPAKPEGCDKAGTPPLGPTDFIQPGPRSGQPGLGVTAWRDSNEFIEQRVMAQLDTSGKAPGIAASSPARRCSRGPCKAAEGLTLERQSTVSLPLVATQPEGRWPFMDWALQETVVRPVILLEE